MEKIKSILFLVVVICSMYNTSNILKADHIINVPLLRQCDSQWGSNQLGTCSGLTMCSDGCAVTCETMLLKTNGVNINPGQLNTYLTQNGGYSSGCSIIWTTAAGYPGSSMTYTGSATYNLSTIKAEIDADDPVIVNVTIPQNHFIVVYGYTGTGTSASNFNVWDPLYTTSRNLSNYNNIVGLRLFENVYSVNNYTVNFTVNNNSSLNGWFFWKAPIMPSNFYTVHVTNNIPPGNNWSLYIFRGSANIAQIVGNQSTNNYNFVFSVNSNDPLFPNGGGYHFILCPQGHPETIWGQSSDFYISSLPTMTLSLSPQAPYTVGQSIIITWNFTGGVPGLPYGGLTGYITLQYYQNGNPLTNIVQRPISDNNYTLVIPASIPGGTIPGCYIQITASNQNGNAPNGYVYAFSNPQFCINGVTGIKEHETETPQEFNLFQNYPNPFNPSTQIKFAIPNISATRISIYDAIGKKVIDLVNKELSPGFYSINWDASEYPSGIYFVRIDAGDFNETKKMLLLK